MKQLRPEELRIGNLIRYDDIDVKVIALADNNISCYDKRSDQILRTSIISGKIFEPIPLTEEKLLDLGFEKEVLKNGRIILTLNTKQINGHRWELSFAISNDKIEWCQYVNDLLPIEIKFVHQLQNLCHALTNFELTIK